MNKTPAFSDTSNTAFHLPVYWRVFKVSAHYKKTTYFYCLLVQLVAGSLECNRGGWEKSTLFPVTKLVTYRKYKKWAEHIISIYPTDYYLFMCAYEIHSKLLKLHKNQPTRAHRTGAIMGGLRYFYAFQTFLYALKIILYLFLNFR